MYQPTSTNGMSTTTATTRFYAPKENGRERRTLTAGIIRSCETTYVFASERSTY